MITYFTKITFGSPAYDEALKLRYKLLREPLGMSYEIDDIVQETDQMHFGLYRLSTDTLLACASIIPEGARWKMRQVAVSPEYQAKGYGRLLVLKLEQFAKASRAKEIYCHARMGVDNFYEKLQYHKIGEIFSEVTIPHIKMVKKIDE